MLRKLRVITSSIQVCHNQISGTPPPKNIGFLLQDDEIQIEEMKMSPKAIESNENDGNELVNFLNTSLP